MAGDFQVSGTNEAALFTLKVHRGDGMALVAMNWKRGKPPKDFVGFAIESKPPDENKFFPLNNRLTFPNPDGSVNPQQLSTLVSPIQKFRWVHFPRKADQAGKFVYRVTPVFMDEEDRLSRGEPQQAALELRRDTYPGKLNVTFTRGFVSSQAFVDRYEKFGDFKTLVPGKADLGLKFRATHPKADEALAWMGFEAREMILETLDLAIRDKKAQVRVVAYDLNEPEVVSRLEKLGKRLRIIIDDSASHGKTGSAETQAAKRLQKSAGKDNVKRQHMKSLQHNKSIMVDGPTITRVIFGSTNLSWRGLYVQANNALIVDGKTAVRLGFTAFDNYFDNEDGFGDTESAEWQNLGLAGINAKVAFSPHNKSNALLETIGEDMLSTKSSMFYSLAFLSITPGIIKDAITKVTRNKKMFVYGISDKKTGGIVLRKPDGNIAPVFAAPLSAHIPPPFSEEPSGGGGNRMHHKFVVLDFDKPDARVYLGSYNFSNPADRKNGENLLVIRDRRIAVSYMIEALRIFDHYHFRVAQQEAKKARKTLQLAKPPRARGEKPWWDEYYTDERKARDRTLFA